MIAAFARSFSASARCNRSTMRPSIAITPLPAFSGRANASLMARAPASASADGEKAWFAGPIWAGVDQRLAVKAHGGPFGAFAGKSVKVAKIIGDAVDDVEAAGAGGEHELHQPRHHIRKVACALDREQARDIVRQV